MQRRQFLSLSAGVVFMEAPLPVQPPTPSIPLEKPKLLPPDGIPVAEEVRRELSIATEWGNLRREIEEKPNLKRYLPDVEVYYKAVEWSVQFGEIFSEKEIEVARNLLKTARERAEALRQGKTPWLEQAGNVVLGYQSRIDGSVQPYGLVIPSEYRKGDKPRRLDFFLHGRGEKLTELAFIAQRERSAGEFVPEGAFVLHPYGRFCNANRFAGEVDLFEALADVKSRFPIDENRIVVRGFSMGGAACWQFAVHHAGLWVAAAPGAGFAESPEYTRAFAEGKTPPPWYEQKLWHLYDATDYALNLANCPTVAYSGELDKQKQAADRMSDAMAKEGLTLTHIIGPKTEHKYHPDSKKEINAFIDTAVAKGRNPLPDTVRFTTWTLRYPTLLWVTVQGLGSHWERAKVEATFANGAVTAKTENITSISFTRPDIRTVVLDGKSLPYASRYVREPKSGQWRVAKKDEKLPGKHPGLQGPIDDAFMEPFLFVEGNNNYGNDALRNWVSHRYYWALEGWRRTFRGDAPRTDIRYLTDEQRRTNNLILWGDPESNTEIKRILPKLPLRWNTKEVQIGNHKFPANRYVPVLIYPSPYAPNRYVVLNSGYTFIEFSAASNAQHAPKLPDWAIIDMTVPGVINTPGKVAMAGFFDEQWRFVPQKG